MSINATLLGQAISFLLFVWFCMKFVWPPLMNAIEERQKKIADGLADAGRAAKDLELAQVKATEQLKDAKATANEIIEQANKRKAQIVDEAKVEADTERAKIIAQGHAEIENERNRVKEDLRKQVAALAIAGAEKILERSIDEAAHSDIVNKLVAEL
ncbi:F0F1 ATP synthase subunit B [Shewanella schlegeliana]|uniref:ATP synthase subunit b n=2 Tax=Shewanella TaxID=22 RepID=ATPF_SHEHH|nr:MULTISPECIES: F0F1 ATP synthase subunit B [Shewanella]B0TQF8.1 RecName: Full=ATP synthase subunit b; AltName: Full=ATP synthase F(0) sector subunit b; AltName: Full=ATPase subunit I; AltName: Full=F-type ATPase subunit b; Short=F-ATPase subunit b [Shewanella halifaxensis HAW-EB4]ABZ78838.1 ATP synthase F0, B subunit [Shewanella halifaxensis HAW-EB4]MBL4915367.1 F0F1 ATP synthase subunit B [Shewanella schlegeliana]MCG9731100.1 F0F1 ATP synthase subunit B [Shewanella sp. Isolate13]MCL1111469.